jgi:hypothetical protein
MTSCKRSRAFCWGSGASGRRRERDRLRYFEVYFTDDLDGPGVVLSLPTDGLTAEKMANHAAEADGSRRRAK